MDSIQSGVGTDDQERAVEVAVQAIQCEVYSRIVGYVRPVRAWNKGKKQEFTERKEYVMLDVPDT
jgi:anaerobic ribonucleoside-triphosphate reductase